MAPADKKTLLEALDVLNLAIVSRGITLRAGDREKFEAAVRIAKAIPESFGYLDQPKYDWVSYGPTIRMRNEEFEVLKRSFGPPPRPLA